jgi:Protein of unknown function (DUF763)
MMRTACGGADLPLHGGHVPKWLGDRMMRLGAVITEGIVLGYGCHEMLRRLAHPFPFQSFRAVIGMDWLSSDIITSVIGALKWRLTPLSAELGIHVCGGRDPCTTLTSAVCGGRDPCTTLTSARNMPIDRSTPTRSGGIRRPASISAVRRQCWAPIP